MFYCPPLTTLVTFYQLSTLQLEYNHLQYAVCETLPFYNNIAPWITNAAQVGGRDTAGKKKATAQNVDKISTTMVVKTGNHCMKFNTDINFYFYDAALVRIV